MRDQLYTLRPVADEAAIGLSLLCAIHCLALLIVIALLPSVTALVVVDDNTARFAPAPKAMT